MTSTAASFLLTIGGILLIGLVTNFLGRHTFLPRVTLLLLFGVLIGHSGFNLIPQLFTTYFDVIADMALVMIGFLLGGKLTFSRLQKSARHMLWISLTAAMVTVLLVIIVLTALGISLPLAILLGCIAAATAPAAIYDVVNESQHQGHFSDLLLAIVAIDDAWALIFFSIGVALIASMTGMPESIPLVAALQEIFGAILLGAVIGYPAALITGRIQAGQPILSEALGLVFLCGGLALWLNVSFLIASMVMGMVVANTARHHEYPFHEIRNIESPVMIVFFVLAGASLEIKTLTALGWVGIAYIISRSVGKIFGAYIGACFSRADKTVRNWMGPALLPQAGVAIGMALVASNYFPEHRQILLSIVISSTVFFEIIGPVFTRIAINRATARNN